VLRVTFKSLVYKTHENGRVIKWIMDQVQTIYKIQIFKEKKAFQIYNLLNNCFMLSNKKQSELKSVQKIGLIIWNKRLLFYSRSVCSWSAFTLSTVTGSRFKTKSSPIVTVIEPDNERWASPDNRGPIRATRVVNLAVIVTFI